MTGQDDLSAVLRHNLPPLNALRAFDAFARCGSLRAAAADLGVVSGAVRQQLTTLEEHFGFPLLIRKNGRVTLSQTGQRLADAVGVALAIISRASDEIASKGQNFRLRLGVPMPMAAAWFIPRMAQLQNALPWLEVDVVAVEVVQTLSDLPDLDAMIVGGEYRPLPDIAATAFLRDEFGPVAAHMLTGPTASLGLMTALVARNTPYLWDDWFRESGQPPLRFTKRLEVEDLTFALASAKAGLGCTIAPRACIEVELVSGALVASYGFVTRPTGYRLCCRTADRNRKPIVALRDWLVGLGHASAGNLPGGSV